MESSEQHAGAALCHVYGCRGPSGSGSREDSGLFMWLHTPRPPKPKLESAPVEVVQRRQRLLCGAAHRLQRQPHAQAAAAAGRGLLQARPKRLDHLLRASERAGRWLSAGATRLAAPQPERPAHGRHARSTRSPWARRCLDAQTPATASAPTSSSTQSTLKLGSSQQRLLCSMELRSRMSSSSAGY